MYAYLEDIQWSEQHPGHVQSNVTLTQHNRSLSTKVRVQLQGVICAFSSKYWVTQTRSGRLLASSPGMCIQWIPDLPSPSPPPPPGRPRDEASRLLKLIFMSNIAHMSV